MVECVKAGNEDQCLESRYKYISIGKIWSIELEMCFTLSLYRPIFLALEQPIRQLKLYQPQFTKSSDMYLRVSRLRMPFNTAALQQYTAAMAIVSAPVRQVASPQCIRVPN